jgi:hypothetical protein
LDTGIETVSSSRYRYISSFGRVAKQRAERKVTIQTTVDHANSPRQLTHGSAIGISHCPVCSRGREVVLTPHSLASDHTREPNAYGRRVCSSTEPQCSVSLSLALLFDVGLDHPVAHWSSAFGPEDTALPKTYSTVLSVSPEPSIRSVRIDSQDPVVSRQVSKQVNKQTNKHRNAGLDRICTDNTTQPTTDGLQGCRPYSIRVWNPMFESTRVKSIEKGRRSDRIVISVRSR